MRAETDGLDRKQYLSFTLGGGDYAVGILQVKEILQYEAITPVPGTPPSIRGVINLRGSVVAVVDLAVKLGLPEAPITRFACILIVEVALEGTRTVMGVMTDSVSEVIDLGPEDVEAPPSFGTQVRVDHLLGMGKIGKKFVLLLDIDRAISAGEKELAAVLEKGGLAAPRRDEPPDAPAAAPAADSPGSAAGAQAA
jgi:purine-binding chemotaxis protein CheW